MDKQSKDALTSLGGVLAVGVVTGSLLQGLWLSSRILSPLVAGGVLGSIVPALFLTFYILSSLKKLCEGNGRREDLKDVANMAAWTATSVVIGVGLGASPQMLSFLA